MFISQGSQEVGKVISLSGFMMFVCPKVRIKPKDLSVGLKFKKDFISEKNLVFIN